MSVHFPQGDTASAGEDCLRIVFKRGENGSSSGSLVPPAPPACQRRPAADRCKDTR